MTDVCRKYGHCTDFVVMFNCRCNNVEGGLIALIPINRMNLKNYARQNNLKTDR